MEKEIKTTKIVCKFPAGNTVEDSATIEELFINYLRFCNPTPVDNEIGRPPPLAAVKEVDNYINSADDAIVVQQFFWGNTPGNQATEELKECYKKIVFHRKNLFLLTKGSSGKDYIKEI